MSTSILVYKSDSLISAKYYDGHSARGKEVSLEFIDSEMLVHFADGAEKLHFRLEGLCHSGGSGKSMLLLALPGGGQLAIAKCNEARALLTVLESRRGRLLRFFEENLGSALALGVAAVGLLGLLYLYGLPIAVQSAHPLLSHEAKDRVGRQVLSILESRLLSETKLEAKETEEIERVFEGLATVAGHSVPPDLLIRRIHFDLSGKGEGAANAIAILPKTIVVSDELYRTLAAEELEAVIAHEIGHLHYDHGGKALLRGSLLSLSTLFLFGPNPELLLGLGLSVAELRYSRDNEREADAYATELLLRLGKDPAALGRALQRLDAHYGSAEHSSFSQYLNSHPITVDRIKAIENSLVEREVK